jgi:glycosyltransferase involved in cell wall biosynthesis
LVAYPKVSILIPVYNGADFLEEAIDSALAQTYPNIEILVVNDGSDDGGRTEAIAVSYGARIKYFVKENGGVATALNLSIEKMSGDYCSWLSHDDLYTPDKLQVEMDAMLTRAQPRTVIYSDYAVFAKNPDKAVRVSMKGVPPQQFRHWISLENSLHGCTLLLPRQAFEECGVFNKALKTTQDYDLWFRMAAKYDFVHVPEILVKARSHENQGSVTMAKHALVECNNLFIGFTSELSSTELTRQGNRSVAFSYAEIAVSFWLRGFHDAARFAAGKAMANTKQSASVRDFVEVVTLLGKTVLKYYLFKCARKLLSPSLRIRIKHFLRLVSG